MIAPSNSRPQSEFHPPSRREGWDEARISLTDVRSRDEMRTGLVARATDVAGRHPIIAVVTATTIGIVAGWLVKRKY